MNNEIWKTIDEHPSYEVSTHGNIRHKKKKNIKSPSTNLKGYLYVGLYKKETKKNIQRLIHHLVAKAFIENSNNLNSVDHINFEEKTNNHVSNLRWANNYLQAQNKSTTINAKGIFYMAGRKKPYLAYITRNGENHKMYFKTEEEAKAWRADILAQYA
jgi:hypothetical protein